jgi:hypothetical protein
MNINRQYPVSYTIVAGLAGAIAWGFPYLVDPFLQLIRFMPDFPIYEVPPFQVPLAKLTFSYALTGIIAGSLFLAGIRFLPINRKRYSRPAFSLATALSILVGLAIGGASAILIGLLAGSSYIGWKLADSLGFGFLSGEPYLSIGWVLGVALAAIIIVFFSGIIWQLTLGKDSPLERTLKIALDISGIALVIRGIVCFLHVAYLSFASNSRDFPIGIFLLFQVVSGAFFGVYIWKYCSRLKAA